jgi:putative transposase
MARAPRMIRANECYHVINRGNRPAAAGGLPDAKPRSLRHAPQTGPSPPEVRHNGQVLWQGRYKACLIQQDTHLLTVLRYVERNALAKNLCCRAEDWRWGSLNWRASNDAPITLTTAPIELPRWWVEFVNQPMTAAELSAVRDSVNRQRPFGSVEWTKNAAHGHGIEQSLAPIGRPRKKR